MDNTEIHEKIRVNLGKKTIELLEKIQLLIKTEPKTDLDITTIQQLQNELAKTTDIFGRMTYPFWNLNKKE